MSEETPQNSFPWPTALALVAAAVAVAGSLYLSLGMNLLACPLCFYQRSFAFAAFGILLVGLATRARFTGYVNLFALLPTVAGGLIAGWHTYLEASGKLVCPKGIADFGTTPQQSLASFVAVLVFLLPGIFQHAARRRISVASVGWTLLLGAAFAYGCVVSAPPPSQPKPELRPRICHPPVTD